MIKIVTSLLVLLVLSGCASSHTPGDALESVNRVTYAFNDTVDKDVVQPVARGYVKVMPDIGRTIISNFFSNLGDITVTINDFLQCKVKQGASDGMRFVVNTTIGILGAFDVASKAGLEKHREDFGLTLAYWGVGNGSYLVIPFFGPSTLRDGVGMYADYATYPVTTDVATRNEMLVTEGINKRAELLNSTDIMSEAAIDPYAFTRDTYLAYRKNLTYDGHPPKVNYDDN